MRRAVKAFSGWPESNIPPVLHPTGSFGEILESAISSAALNMAEQDITPGNVTVGDPVVLNNPEVRQ